MEKVLRTFNYVKLPELQFELEQITTESGRRYVTPDGNSYPSITTILGEYNKKAIYEWRQRVGNEEANRISTKASNRGTKLHGTVEKYLLNEMSDMQLKMLMPDLKEMFSSIKNKIDENVGTIYGIEQRLYSDRLKISGTCDCIAEWNGKLSIVDWKTSNRPKVQKNIENYFMQAAAYAEMFEERTGQSIEQVVVAIAVQSDFPQVFVEEKHKYITPLNYYIESYHSNEDYTSSNIDDGAFDCCIARK
jgi:genome maintenance exonuclease 1